MAEGETEKEKKQVKPKRIKEGKRVQPFLKQCNKRFDLIKPTFSRDTSRVICGCGSDIYLFHRKTGEIDNIFKNHSDNVIFISMHQSNPLQVISCCKSKLIIWDYTDLTVIKTINIATQNVGAIDEIFVDPSLDMSYIYCKHQVFPKKKLSSDMKYFELIKLSTKDGTIDVIGNVNREHNTVKVSSNGKYVVFCFDMQLMVYDVERKKTRAIEFEDPNDRLCCVAISPGDTCIATGDKNGRILLWYNPFNKKANDSKSRAKLHWHHLLVADLAFSSDGLYLMSIGNEPVLVVWHLEKQSKSFIPNLGCQMKSIFCSKDNRYIGLVFNNNTINILSGADHTVKSSIKFLSPCDDVSSGLSYHSKMKSLVLNGCPEGTLQFYQPETDSVTLTLDILGENLIKGSKQKAAFGTVINKVAFNDYGKWMATECVRTTRVLPMEQKLSFWMFLEESKSFFLNTLVNPPHNKPMVSMFFRPRFSTKVKWKKNMLVTASSDGEVKSWVLQVTETNRGDYVSEQWILDNILPSTGSDCKMAKFSSDGSLLAVLYDEVTLLDPDTLTIHTNLNWPSKKSDSLKAFCFCHNDNSHILVGYSANYIIVWNLKTGGIHWQLQANVQKIVSDPYSNLFAAVLQIDDQNRFFLFQPNTPSPVAVIPNIDVGPSTIHDMIFIKPRGRKHRICQHWPPSGRIYLLTDDTCIHTITDFIEEENTEYQTNKDAVEKMSVFDSIYQNKDMVITTDDDYSHFPLGNPSKSALNQMMSTPSHILPTTEMMCQAFYHSLFLGKSRKEGKAEDEGMINEEKTSEDIDEKSSTEEEEEYETEDSDNNLKKDSLEGKKKDVEFSKVNDEQRNQRISQIKAEKPKIKGLKSFLL